MLHVCHDLFAKSVSFAHTNFLTFFTVFFSAQLEKAHKKEVDAEAHTDSL